MVQQNRQSGQQDWSTSKNRNGAEQDLPTSKDGVDNRIGPSAKTEWTTTRFTHQTQSQCCHKNTQRHQPLQKLVATACCKQRWQALLHKQDPTATKDNMLWKKTIKSNLGGNAQRHQLPWKFRTNRMAEEMTPSATEVRQQAVRLQHRQHRRRG